MCGIEVQKATKIVILFKCEAKLIGLMYPLSEKHTHNSLLIDYETLEYDCIHYNKGTFKAWWHRETVCGLEVQKATQIVDYMSDTCEAGVHAHAHKEVHSQDFV